MVLVMEGICVTWYLEIQDNVLSHGASYGWDFCLMVLVMGGISRKL